MSGRVLGDYEVIKQIGHGALGTVLLAEHRFMKQQFMLKVLPEELASDRNFIQRFQEQIGLLAGLEHPNIVKIHNVSFAQGLYFLVSDCVVDEIGETTNLAQYLIARGGTVDEETTYTILHQIASALDYAHCKKRGDTALVHGGLKPNNILISRSKPSINVKLCDFGLTMLVGEAAMLTRTYRVVSESLGIVEQVFPPATEGERYSSPSIDSARATPLHQSFLQSFSFLAPEQKNLAQKGQSGTRADAYAFGVLAYSLLMQHLPEGYFPLPSTLPAAQFQWDALLASCLAFDPAARPAILVDALESVKKGGHSVPVMLDQEQGTSNETVTLLDKLRETQAVQQEVSTGGATASTVVTGAAASASTPTSAALAPTSNPVNSSNTEMAASAVMAPPQATTVAAAPQQTAVQAAHQQQVPQPVFLPGQLQRPEIDPDPAKSFQVDSTVKHYNPEKKEVKETQPILTDMVVIQEDMFFRGSTDGNRDEMPRHQVALKSFAIDIHPVANEQFVRFLEVMGGEKDHNHQDLIKLKESRIKRSGGKLSIESGYAKHPVVGITWYGAVAFAKWIGKRLPTEAEWEIAGLGKKDGAHFPTGNEIEKSQANFFSSDTTAVMSYAPNEHGLYDVAGNVYEWCQDWYGYNYYEASAQEPDDPRGPLQGVYRVLRGGCWKSLKEDLRCSRRHRNNPGTTNSTYGFRCAADVQ